MPLILNPDALGRVHFIGICGTAMAGVAAALNERGVAVTGSDMGVYPPMSDYLAERKIEVREGYRAENLDPAPDLVVVGNAVSRGNPEVEALLESAIPFVSLAELIESAFLPGRQPVVITGTHGKTTTSALTSWILKDAGLAPSWLVGGVVPDLGDSFHIGGGAPFVLEGDEYDTAFFDKRPKFIHYRPKILVLGNLEYDHADIYPDIERIREVFRHLLRLVPRTGLVIANGDDPEVRALLPHCHCPVETYTLRGAEDAAWSGEFSNEGQGTLHITGPAGERLMLRHNLVGEHQGYNLLAATAVARRLGVATRSVEDGVRGFRGIKRRGEKVGEERGVSVYDDFAHHPTAIASTLKGFRARYPGRRLWVAVEPRSNTMRTNIFQEELGIAFAGADRVCVRALPDPQKVAQDERLDIDKLVAQISANGTDARVYADADSIVATINAGAERGDVVIVFSNGGFEGIHGKLLHALAQGDRR